MEEMKYWHPTFAVLLVGLLSACHQVSQEEREVFETPFPQELFLSYFPNMNAGDSLLYVTNDTLDKKTLVLYVQSARTDFEPYGEYPELLYDIGALNESAGIEDFNHEVTLSQDKRNTYLILAANCYQRQQILFRCINYHSNGYLESTQDKPTNTIFSMLTDTIPLLAEKDTTAILVRHKGLVWFKDEDGTRWYLTAQ